MNRLVPIALVGLLGITCPRVTLSAEPEASSGDGRPSVKELRHAREGLDKQLNHEKEALAQAKKRFDDEISRRTQRRDDLAEHLLTMEMRRRKRSRELDQLKAKASKTEQTTAALGEAFERLRTAANAFAIQAGIELTESPARSPMRSQVRRWQRTLDKKQTDSQPPRQLASPMLGLLDVAGTLHDQATSVGLRRTRIWTARGEREQVELLSVGFVVFAYRTVKDKRIGMAMANPTQARGFRWSEALPRTGSQAIDRAISRLGAKPKRSGKATGSYVRMPTDVSGRLGPKALGRQETLAGALISGGPVMLPLAALAAGALLLIVERIFVLYIRNGPESRSAQRLLASCDRGDWGSASERSNETRGAVGRTLAACLQRREQGQHAMEDGIQEQLLHELPRLNRFLGGLAILAAVAPLLGLLGTVTGIMETFGVIRSFGNADPGLMAGGISQALVTTATGLVIAIPVLLIHRVLRGRVERIVAESERQAATLVNQVSYGHPPNFDSNGQSQTASGSDSGPVPSNAVSSADSSMEGSP